METASKNAVNNDLYDELGERWYTAGDDPVALLRAESRSRNPWIIGEIDKAFPNPGIRILDVGCGAGFLSNELAKQGFNVTGIDASESSLAVARQYDSTHSVKYELGDAYRLPYADESFEVVCAMDFLEHVEPRGIIQEIARVLKPEGLFFFHTFNRNFLSWLIVIKGVEWFVKNTPKNLHVLHLFIKPAELREICEANHLRIQFLKGFAPKLNQLAFWRMLLTRTVSDDFKFEFTNSTLTGYAGFAKKLG
ncbi:MAG: bifunctional 2-polyprenyl-6-hydroxyphenol methylase/3-demethylubiquinol 3-O-methyltransferase UbiG [Acidobacteriota bacterium]